MTYSRMNEKDTVIETTDLCPGELWIHIHRFVQVGKAREIRDAIDSWIREQERTPVDRSVPPCGLCGEALRRSERRCWKCGTEVRT